MHVYRDIYCYKMVTTPYFPNIPVPVFSACFRMILGVEQACLSFVPHQTLLKFIFSISRSGSLPCRGRKFPLSPCSQQL